MNRPYLILKIATSLDGKIACFTGDSKWITGKQARMHGHILRGQSDAILTGRGSVIKDDPLLTCRLDYFQGKQPDVLLLDSKLGIPLSSRLFSVKGRSVLIFTKIDNLVSLPKSKIASTLSYIETPLGQDQRLCLRSIMNYSAQKGIRRILIESGGKILSSLLALRMIDELYWYRAPIILGNDALPAFGNFQIEHLKKAFNFNKIEYKQIGKDILEHYQLEQT